MATETQEKNIKFYKVEKHENHENYTILKYTRFYNENTSTNEIQNALKLKQRCDDAIFRTNFLLSNLKNFDKTNFIQRKDSYINEIIIYAKNGLESGDIIGANDELDTFERQFVDFEGPPIRQKFLSKTLSFSFIFGSSFLIAALSIYLIDFSLNKILNNIWGIRVRLPIEPIKAFLLIIAGTSLGVSLSAFTRNLNMNFQNLGKFDSSGLNPSFRFVFVMILSIVFAIFLHQDIITICFGGNYCLDKKFIEKDGNIIADEMKCIIMGIICGLGDVIITRLLTETVSRAENKPKA